MRVEYSPLSRWHGLVIWALCLAPQLGHAQDAGAAEPSSAGTPDASPDASPGQPGGADLTPLRLRVAIVEDPDFPEIDDDLLGRALLTAATSFGDRFSVPSPSFSVVGRFTLDGFMRRYAAREREACADLFAAMYRGGGRPELERHRDAALRFFRRFRLDELRGFLPEDKRADAKSAEDVWPYYVETYLSTVAKLLVQETPAGQPLLKLGGLHWRSHAVWSCALGEQTDFDVVVTNTFVLADKLDEPHPHAVFGKAKVGGIAGPNPARHGLGGQVLMASTFAIDTAVPFLSELNGRPASTAERADMLGEFLLAHEIAHAIFGIPDVFDHPPQCLMTSRPGETYREGLAALREHPGPCPECQPWVRARALLDRGRRAYESEDWPTAVRELTAAASATPKRLHGGYGHRLSLIGAMLAESHGRLGNEQRARTYADMSVKLDPGSVEAKQVFQRWAPELAASKRTIPSPGPTSTRTSTAPTRKKN